MTILVECEFRLEIPWKTKPTWLKDSCIQEFLIRFSSTSEKAFLELAKAANRSTRASELGNRSGQFDLGIPRTRLGHTANGCRLN